MLHDGGVAPKESKPRCSEADVFLAGLSSARADAERSEPIQVTYAADRTCPTREQFIASVRRYATKWRLADHEPTR
jgi:hypothetical protein